MSTPPRALTILLILFFCCLHSLSVAAHNTSVPKQPPDEGIELSLPMILKGVLNTAQFKKLQLALLVKDNAQQRLQAQLDAQWGANITVLNSHAESALGPLSIDDTQHYQLKFFHNKMLKSGTLLNSEWMVEHRATAFSGTQVTDSSSYQSQLAVSVRQSLGHNRFGRTYAMQQNAARSQAQATEHRVEAQMESMLLDIVQIYHRAWLLRQQLSAAYRYLAMQWRAHKVVRAKHELGTAETTDLLSSKNALAAAQQQVHDTEKILRDIWYQLAIPLRLPDAYLGIEMAKLTLTLERDIDFATDTCQAWQRHGYNNLKSAQLRYLQASHASLRQQLAVHKDRLQPDIFVSLRLANNGADASFTKSLSNSVLSANPSLSLNAGITMTLGNHAVLTDLKDTLQQQHLNELSAEQERERLRLTALTVCAQVQRLLNKEKSLQQVLYNNKEQVALLEERFNLGQVDVLRVIAAGRSVVATELQLQEVIRDMANGVWQTRITAGGFMDYLRSVITP